MTEDDVVTVTKRVMRFLVDKEYQQLLQYAKDSDPRISAQVLAEDIAEYPGAVIFPPEETFQSLEMVRVNSPFPIWHVAMPLWSSSGMSDATMELHIGEREGKPYIAFLGAHVL
jgi:hypothetical protein